MPLNGHIANREVIGMKSEHLFEYLAKQRGISVPELRKLISIRIESAILSDNPLEKSQWERIPHKGQIPTPDEWLQYVIATLKKKNWIIFCGCLRKRSSLKNLYYGTNAMEMLPL